jgi:hypothetical protein
MPLSPSHCAHEDQTNETKRPNGSSKGPLCAPHNNNNNTPYLYRATLTFLVPNKTTTSSKQTAAAMEGNQKKADASVKKSKAFFLIGLTVTAIATAIGSGYLVAQSETNTFEEKVRAVLFSMVPIRL